MSTAMKSAHDLHDEGTLAPDRESVSHVRATAPVLEAAGATDAGRVRRDNQDAFALLPDLGLCLVADGMGGAPGGDLAARMAIAEVTRFFAATDPDQTPPWAWDISQGLAAGLLSSAVTHANAAIYGASLQNAARSGMGTTLAALLLAGSRAVVAHVGDSRVYRLRGGGLERLTEDHSHAELYLKSRGGAADPLVYHQNKPLLTRALGTHATVRVDVQVETIAPGDLFLLCSDGLWGCLTHRAMAETIANAPNLDAAAAALVARANEAGGPDNVTVVLMKPGEERRGA